MAWEITIGERTFEVSIESAEQGRFVLSLDGETRQVDACFPEDGVLHLIREGEAFEVDVQRTEHGQDITLYGTRYSASVLDEQTKALRALGMGDQAGSGAETISTAMPGKVVALLVAEGQEVTAGDGIVVVEAMKMENELRCAADGVVKEICVGVGDAVVGGANLVRLGPREDS